MVNGIDVSKWQGTIDWPKVAASGIKFAMIKVGSGSSRGAYTLDSQFQRNITGALAAGIAVGAYLYSYALTPDAAAGEAAWVIKQLAPYKDKITFPVAYDLEDKTQESLGKPTLTAMCRAFTDAIRAAGYIPALYASKYWLESKIDAAAVNADLWVAQWGDKLTYARQCAIWQYSDKGSVAGISGAVDLNTAYKDYAPGKPSDWAAEAWELAKSAGILDGTNPQGNITREQLAVVLFRLGAFAPAPGLKVEPPDAASDWASEAWRRAFAAGAFDGTNPQGVVTREQLAVVLHRLNMIGG
jgi:GH25 family lysozyme M1 (1,4-beta-N-acetylmuramidase)